MEGKTFADIASEFNQMYSARMQNGFLKKGDKGKIFQEIMNYLFNKYGQYHNIHNINVFKSCIIQAKNRQKNDLKNKEKFYQKDDSFIQKTDFDQISFRPEENCEDSLRREIEELNLNPDSYF